MISLERCFSEAGIIILFTTQGWQYILAIFASASRKMLAIWYRLALTACILSVLRRLTITSGVIVVGPMSELVAPLFPGEFVNM